MYRAHRRYRSSSFDKPCLNPGPCNTVPTARFKVQIEQPQLHWGFQLFRLDFTLWTSRPTHAYTWTQPALERSPRPCNMLDPGFGGLLLPALFSVPLPNPVGSCRSFHTVIIIIKGHSLRRACLFHTVY